VSHYHNVAIRHASCTPGEKPVDDADRTACRQPAPM
jgi:hypothetical protein